jgi:hypothetical protein
MLAYNEIIFIIATIVPIDNSSTIEPYILTIPTLTNVTCPDEEVSIISVSVLMGGIVASRFGRYLLD